MQPYWVYGIDIELEKLFFIDEIVLEKEFVHMLSSYPSVERLIHSLIPDTQRYSPDYEECYGIAKFVTYRWLILGKAIYWDKKYRPAYLHDIIVMNENIKDLRDWLKPFFRNHQKLPE